MASVALNVVPVVVLNVRVTQNLLNYQLVDSEAIQVAAQAASRCVKACYSGML